MCRQCVPFEMAEKIDKAAKATATFTDKAYFAYLNEQNISIDDLTDFNRPHPAKETVPNV